MKIQPYQTRMIHTLKGALKLDDDTYRAVLSGYGVTSSKELTDHKAAELTIDLTAKAVAAGVWKNQAKGERGKVKGENQTRAVADDRMSTKIRALWLELHAAEKVRDPSEKALAAYVKRMSGKNALQWCSVADKTAIIEGLKKWLERQP